MRERRVCGKKAYETWRHASFDARALNHRGRVRVGHADPYWCPQCRAFHVGHREDRPRRRAQGFLRADELAGVA